MKLIYYAIRIGKPRKPHTHLWTNYQKQGDGYTQIVRLFSSIRNAEIESKELTTSDFKIVKVKVETAR